MARRPNNSSTGWHPADIVAALRKKGTNLNRLAEASDLSRSSVRKALRRVHPRANRLIAEAIGVDLHTIWPDWFDKAGTRKHPSPDRASKQPSESSPAILSARKAA